MTMSSTNPTPTTLRPSRRWRDILVLGGLFGLVLFGLIGLAAATGWEETKAQLARIGIAQFTILLVLSCANYLLRGVRWHLFARALGLRTGLIQDLRHFLGGFAMSVTPGKLGELIRLRWIRRETGWSLERTAPLALIDRASDLAAMALILGLAVMLSAAGIAGAVPVAILALLGALVATRPKLLMGFVTITYRLFNRWPRGFARIRTSARGLRYFSHPAVLIPTLALGAAGWFAEGYAFYLLLAWMGADIGLWLSVAIFVFSTLAGGLTGASGGVGGAEAAMVALLSLQGVPPEVSLPATAIIRVTTLWFAIGIGLLIFPIAERQSLKVKNALED